MPVTCTEEQWTTPGPQSQEKNVIFVHSCSTVPRRLRGGDRKHIPQERISGRIFEPIEENNVKVVQMEDIFVPRELLK